MSRTVRSGTLANYADVARQAGLDPYAMLRRIGIDPQALSDPDLHISGRHVAELLELSAEQAGAADFALRMALGRRLSDMGVVTLSLSNQPTLRNVLAVMTRYRRLVNASLAIQLQEVDDITDVNVDLLIETEGPKTQAYLLSVAVLFQMFAAILGPHWRPVRAHFVHARPANTTLYRQLFGTHVEFNADHYGISCLTADLDIRNRAADSGLARHAGRLLDTLHEDQPISISFEVRKSVYMLLPLGRCSIRRVAANLGVTERTLQRRLGEDGEEFSDIVQQVRHELAERYIANPGYSMTRIADMLGYSQLSSFTRWFASEFGVAPMVWRRQMQPRDRRAAG